MDKVRALSKAANLQRKKAFFYRVKEIVLRSRLMQPRDPFANQNAIEMQQEETLLKNSLRPLFFPESNQDSLENAQDHTLMRSLGLERLV